MTDNVMYDVNIKARSHNHSCRGKAIIITYSERVFVALFIQRAKCMCPIILSFEACLALAKFCHIMS